MTTARERALYLIDTKLEDGVLPMESVPFLFRGMVGLAIEQMRDAIESASDEQVVDIAQALELACRFVTGVGAQ